MTPPKEMQLMSPSELISEIERLLRENEHLESHLEIGDVELNLEIKRLKEIVEDAKEMAEFYGNLSPDYSREPTRAAPIGETAREFLQKHFGRDEK